jgi:hypothetical protein
LLLDVLLECLPPPSSQFLNVPIRVPCEG